MVPFRLVPVRQAPVVDGCQSSGSACRGSESVAPPVCVSCGLATFLAQLARWPAEPTPCRPGERTLLGEAEQICNLCQLQLRIAEIALSQCAAGVTQNSLKGRPLLS